MILCFLATYVVEFAAALTVGCMMNEIAIKLFKHKTNERDRLMWLMNE